MKTRNLLLTSVLTVAVLGSFAAVLTSSLLPGNVSAAQMLSGHLGAHAGPGHERRWHAHACDSGHTEDMLAMANAWVTISLDLTESQEAALAPVLAAVGRWHDDAGLCEHADIADAPTAMQLLDTLVDHTRTAMDELVPAFTAFYGTLTAEQQARLNAWVAEHHGV